MGLSVELFALDQNGDWIYIECLYSSMIQPSRKLITDTMDGFVWGSTYNSNCYLNERCLTESSEYSATKLSFGVLKTIWKTALSEELVVTSKSITDTTIVCLATGD